MFFSKFFHISKFFNNSSKCADVSIRNNIFQTSINFSKTTNFLLISTQRKQTTKRTSKRTEISISSTFNNTKQIDTYKGFKHFFTIFLSYFNIIKFLNRSNTVCSKRF
jgi:hypothetical protein